MSTLLPSRMSLQARFRFYLLIMAFVLTAITVGLLPRIYHQGLADSSRGMLYAEANDFERRFLLDQTIKPLQTSEISSYLSISDIPQNLLDYFDVDKLKYEQIYLEEWPQGDIYIVCYFYKKILGNTGVTLYQFQVIDVGKRPEHAFSTINKIQWGFAILSLIFVYLLSRKFIQRVVHPAVALSQWLDKYKKDSPPTSLPPNIYNDEIGHVAQKLHEALQDSYDFTEREKQFLQNASHELRTPITVVQNAAELAERQLSMKKGNLNETLSRIKIAAKNMKGLTEALLWLTRVKAERTDDEEIDIGASVDKVLQNNLTLFTNKDWKVEFDSSQVYLKIISKPLFEICIDNLIRNALQHATDKHIKVEYSTSEVLIYNHSDVQHKISHDEILRRGFTSGKGFGIGLSLVAEIAEESGWRFDIKFEEDLAVASLKF